MFKHRYTTALFYLSLLVFVIVIMLLIVKFTSGINDWLYDYEYSQPKYLVENIFNEYFSYPNIEKLSAYSALPEYNAPETEQTAIDYMQDFLRGKEITYSYVAGSNRTVINVKADGKKFARFSIKLSEEKSKYGNDLYELDSIELYYQMPQKSASVKIPFYCTAYVNGKLLTGENISVWEYYEDTRAVIPEGAYAFTAREYKVSGLYHDPEITVFDLYGNEIKPEILAENQYEVKFSYNDEYEKEYSEYVISAIEAYAAYMQDDEYFRNIRDYFDKSTELYSNIYDNPNSFVWPHDGYRFENVSTGEFYAYGDETFSCRIKLDHILEKKGSEDYADHIDMTVYFRKIDGIFVIYAMVSN